MKAMAVQLILKAVIPRIQLYRVVRQGLPACCPVLNTDKINTVNGIDLSSSDIQSRRLIQNILIDREKSIL